ncbi:hypothetical protein XCR_3613 [Xanthomonas campestris pv. raphani 756C]|nr:hypothetical protein XCR_3613 [Xanthomonas campestris pv. raphani 756C]
MATPDAALPETLCEDMDRSPMTCRHQLMPKRRGRCRIR